MRFQEGLQVRLQERYRRLYKSDENTYDRQVKYLRDWLLGQPALRTMLEAIERGEPEVDPAAWFAGVGRDKEWEWPPTEGGRAKVVWWILGQIADGHPKAVDVAYEFSVDKNYYNEMLRDFSDQAVEPLIEYLQERLGSESDMLHLLERYRRRVLWFEQDRLFAQYQADTQHGEAIYDGDLRRFLFEQGIDYPYSQPVSPSGQVDIAAEADSDDPLTCEVKLFDNDRYGASYLARGVTQAMRYAEDYGKTDAHLVIFNLTERPLELPSDEDPEQWPARLHVAGITIFLIVVQTRLRPTASTAGRTHPIAIRREQLLDVDLTEPN